MWSSNLRTHSAKGSSIVSNYFWLCLQCIRTYGGARGYPMNTSTSALAVMQHLNRRLDRCSYCLCRHRPFSEFECYRCTGGHQHWDMAKIWQDGRCRKLNVLGSEACWGQQTPACNTDVSRSKSCIREQSLLSRGLFSKRASVTPLWNSMKVQSAQDKVLVLLYGILMYLSQLRFRMAQPGTKRLDSVKASRFSSWYNFLQLFDKHC